MASTPIWAAQPMTGVLGIDLNLGIGAAGPVNAGLAAPATTERPTLAPRSPLAESTVNGILGGRCRSSAHGDFVATPTDEMGETRVVVHFEAVHVLALRVRQQ